MGLGARRIHPELAPARDYSPVAPVRGLREHSRRPFKEIEMRSIAVIAPLAWLASALPAVAHGPEAAHDPAHIHLFGLEVGLTPLVLAGLAVAAGAALLLKRR